MIGGHSVTDAVRASARELLDSRDSSARHATRTTQAKGKQKAKGESESRRDL